MIFTHYPKDTGRNKINISLLCPVVGKERKIMTTETNDELITALYCRLSVEDEKDKRVSDDESNSISNQKQILLDYCKKHGFKNTMFFVDDGISGTSFERSDFQRMQRMAEEGKICRIIVKDLSRFGREQVEAGRLTQIVYPSLGITFISIGIKKTFPFLLMKILMITRN